MFSVLTYEKKTSSTFKPFLLNYCISQLYFLKFTLNLVTNSGKIYKVENNFTQYEADI